MCRDTFLRPYRKHRRRFGGGRDCQVTRFNTSFCCFVFHSRVGHRLEFQPMSVPYWGSQDGSTLLSLPSFSSLRAGSVSDFPLTEFHLEECRPLRMDEEVEPTRSDRGLYRHEVKGPIEVVTTFTSMGPSRTGCLLGDNDSPRS